MFVPTWIFGVIGIVVIWIAVILYVGQSKGDYDFFFGLIEFAFIIFCAGIVFLLGYGLSSCL